MLEIDGAHGEGGGQVIRSSLALSMLTGQPVKISQIRAGRKKPGLGNQHLTAVEAAVRICQAEVVGNQLGSADLTFAPGAVRGGEYHFRVGTAGSTTLVLQTILPALGLAETSSRVVLEGGTHNPLAPSVDFLSRAYLPQLERMGPRVEIRVEKHGFYPAGGGRILVQIAPSESLRGLELMERGKIHRRRCEVLFSQLPPHVARREVDTLRRLLSWRDSAFEVVEVRDSAGPGNVVSVEIGSRHLSEVFLGFGERGLPAEKVARRVGKEVKQYLDADVPVGLYLADQLMLPMGLATTFGQRSTFRTFPLTQHSRTHLEILKMFLDFRVELREDNAACEVSFLAC